MSTGSLAIAMECLEDLFADSEVLQARFAKSSDQLKAKHIFFGDAELDDTAEPGEQLPRSYIVLAEADHAYQQHADSGSHACLAGRGALLAIIRDYPREKTVKQSHLDFADFISSLIDDIAARITPDITVRFQGISMVRELIRPDRKNRASEDYQITMYQFTWGAL